MDHRVFGVPFSLEAKHSSNDACRIFPNPIPALTHAAQRGQEHKEIAPQLGSKQALIYALHVTMTTTPSRQLRADIHPTGASQWENE